ncbi:MAG: protein tyrosine phosphatase [Acidithiobacillus sp.]|nr:protein tyrosine phosphatase [Acidithiobacillus sp.]
MIAGSQLDRAETRRYRRHQFWTDHGIFRELFYANFHEIAPGLFRAAQPAPWQLSQWQAQHHFDAVLNIRAPAPEEAHFRLEQDACDVLGIAHLPIHGFGSRDLPQKDSLLAFLDQIPELPPRLLVHCKSGADRAGFICVLLQHQRYGMPWEEARKELRLWPYGHIRHANTGILDWFFACLQADLRQEPGLTLRDWVATRYDREQMLASFRPWYRLDWLTDRILRRE